MRNGRALTLACLLLVTLAGAADAAPKKKKKPLPKPTHEQPVVVPAEPKPATPVARAATVEVTVVEIAGGQAYLQPGALAGVQRGSQVVIDSKKFVVVASTSNFAVIEPGNQRIREKAKGIANTGDSDEERPRELPPVAPEASFAKAWPDWRPPSELQHPKAVPLGIPDRNRKFDLVASFNVGGVIPFGPRGSSYFRTEIGAKVHAEPFRAPIALDADVALLKWVGADIGDREGKSARAILRVRELQLSAGNPARWFGAIGRLRYAASTLGSLDGVRLRAPLGNSASVSAFGGLLADPLDGVPSVDAQRFGAEFAYSRPELALRPEGALVLHGSTYKGSIDERRLAGIVGIFPGQSRLGAHFEASMFDADNPWKLSELELTAAGIDASVRVGAFQFGARVDMRQQERSRWLASFFPASWLCISAPNGASPPSDTCADSAANTHYLAGVDANLTTERVALTLGATAMQNPFQSRGAKQLGAFANARILKLLRNGRADLSLAASSGTYVDIYNWSLGPGVSLLGDRLDASVYYRQTFLTYRASSANLLQHAFGGGATYLPGRELLFSLQGEGTTGDDLDALIVFFSTIWRPRF